MRILKDLDAPAGPELAVQPHRIVVHFGDPQAAIRSKINRHRTGDQRFGGDELCREVLLQMDGGERLLGREGPGSLQSVRVEWRIKCWRELLVDSVNDEFLQTGPKARRLIVINHGIAALVTAFAQHPLTGDVARSIVGIGVDPDAAWVELALQAQRVINHHLARQEDQRQLIAECPGLYRIANFFHERLALVEAGQLHASVIADCAPLFGFLLPLLARGQRI